MRESLILWIYAMMNAIASRKCQCGKAWEPEIRRAIAIAMLLTLTITSFAQVPKAESVVLDKVRINGAMWRVAIGDLSKDLDAGHCYYDLHLIYIDRNSVAAERPGILMHEVLHAIIGAKS